MSGKAMPQRVQGDVDSIPEARGNDGVREGRSEEGGEEG